MTEKESLRVKDLEHVLIEKVDQLFQDMLGSLGDRSCLDRGASSPCMPTTYTFIAAVTRKVHAGIERFDHLPVRFEDKRSASFIIFVGRR